MTTATVLDIHLRLLARYGEPDRPTMDAVSEMVSTILSQSTTDINRDRAFGRLRERFPTWEAVRAAPVGEVEDAIRPAGLAVQKAPRIQQALDRVREKAGSYNLDFLRTLPLDEAKAWLTSINGIGPKTAAIILLFSLDRPAFPVDTHVHRVSGRLGLIGPQVSAEKAHILLETQIPPELYLPFHMLLIVHGRQVCQARRPRCEVCALTDVCEYYRRLGDALTTDP